MRARAFTFTKFLTPEPGINHGDPLVPPIGSTRPAKGSKTNAPNNIFKPVGGNPRQHLGRIELPGRVARGFDRSSGDPPGFEHPEAVRSILKTEN